ncbi:hypothetical protein VP01_6315g1 [Puccinia sorghi]|uniref:Uncharacterized protein n=1 Tax=Puccinia sorghi TaxID=27349 RepID=A0A0L6UG97_9BASI|nr:hypothetical protein VP01_6315g1 [Puccinia sorghi]
MDAHIGFQRGFTSKSRTILYYIQFLFVLEDKKNPTTFLSLVKTTSKKNSQIWLEKEAASGS